MMTEDIYVYLVDFPRGIREAVAPCFGGYTVYIDAKLDHDSQIRAYEHAMLHIKRGDFYLDDTADNIEAAAHRKELIS